MEYPLAVFTPQVGTVSETFIRRHVNDLCAGASVTIACQVGDPARSSWSFSGPMLVLDHVEPVQFTRDTGWVFNLGHLNAIREFLQEHRVQVVLGEYLDVCLPLLEICLELDIPFWGHAHGYDISMRLRDPGMRYAYRSYNQAAGIIVGCDWARERLLGLTPDNVYVVPCGVDLPNEPVVRSQTAQIRCLAVGRFVPKKAPLVTLDAFRQALLVCPNLQLDYIGSGDLVPAAQKYIRSHDLERYVTFYGSRSHDFVKQSMRAADIFLQHSMTDAATGDQEMMPVGILEAMAYNLPVVSTRHAGIPEAVQDKITGYLVDEGDTRCMSECIVKLAQDRELRKRMGNAARERVNDRFSWGLERTALLDLLDLSFESNGGAAV
ncbi:MAG: glycosyltransferase family 4 protein [Gemmatimonadetes bacterium]|nr:glycosyltransferase family 4 protein [Gemmatimonadota bacterium]